MSSALALRLQPTTVPPGPRAADRPPLRLLVGGRAPARVAQQASYHRRRVVAALVVLVAVVALTLLVTAAVTRIAGGTPSPAAGELSPTSAAAASAAGVAAPSVVVQPGDTLWTIAASVAPEADVRVTVDRLQALNGRAPIVVGQELELPTA